MRADFMVLEYTRTDGEHLSSGLFIVSINTPPADVQTDVHAHCRHIEEEMLDALQQCYARDYCVVFPQSNRFCNGEPTSLVVSARNALRSWCPGARLQVIVPNDDLYRRAERHHLQALPGVGGIYRSLEEFLQKRIVDETYKHN